MELWHALQEELNRLYEMFVERNPYFEANGGKVKTFILTQLVKTFSFENNQLVKNLKLFKGAISFYKNRNLKNLDFFLFKHG